MPECNARLHGPRLAKWAGRFVDSSTHTRILRENHPRPQQAAPDRGADIFLPKTVDARSLRVNAVLLHVVAAR
jgi:hypothetical protein